MHKKTLLLTAAFICSSISLFAHALWIQTASTAVKGQKHTVEVLLAEDGKNEILPIDKWFSNLKDFTLFLTSPDGTKKQLTVMAATDRFVASFTPDKDGVYILSIAHTSNNVTNARSDFNAEAIVTVGKTKDAVIPIIDNEMKLTGDIKNNYQSGNTINLSYLFKNAPKENIEVQVFAPSGWSKIFETDDKGSIELPLLWSGHYAVEAVYYAEDEPGTYNNKPFKSIRRCLTYTFDSKP